MRRRSGFTLTESVVVSAIVLILCTVVFATAAQVNTFQAPASARQPMVEEFYGFDADRARSPSVHFRRHGQAMVACARGEAGLVPVDPATIDKRAPEDGDGRPDAASLR